VSAGARWSRPWFEGVGGFERGGVLPGRVGNDGDDSARPRHAERGLIEKLLEIV
jgi:hypothetical protein